MDSETFLGPTVTPHLGVDNPLTALGMFSDFSGSDGDGTERASDIDMEEGRVNIAEYHLSSSPFAHSHNIMAYHNNIVQWWSDINLCGIAAKYQ